MSKGDLSAVGGVGGVTPKRSAARWLLPVCWLVAGIGYFGPWIAHPTAALTLTGGDLGEFVKFLPGVVDGTLRIVRQFFYLPPLAVVVSVALLVGCRQLRYPAAVRLPALLLALPLSLQLLPPAWSPASLTTSEFLPQVLAVAVCWLLLSFFWLWGRLPVQLTGSASAILAAATLALAAWQFLVARPAIGQVYGTLPPVGWGFAVCLAGLAGQAAACLALAVLRSPGVSAPDGRQ